MVKGGLKKLSDFERIKNNFLKKKYGSFLGGMIAIQAQSNSFGVQCHVQGMQLLRERVGTGL